jgi:alpha-D-glucose phosphate-specific phosphoglucomutase
LRRISHDLARKSPYVHRHDYIGSYVVDLANVVNMEAIRSSGVKIGIDPLGGASVHFWQPIIERYGIAATIVSDAIDPTFRFMPVDWDGKVRMDCSSPYAIARLISMRDKFDIAFANDTDADRHGIVARSNGLMNPNHYLAAAISYLYENRPDWSSSCAVGKTIVSSGIIDRVAAKLGRKLVEVPVGFKWFVGGLIGGSLGFARREPARHSSGGTDLSPPRRCATIQNCRVLKDMSRIPARGAGSCRRDRRRSPRPSHQRGIIWAFRIPQASGICRQAAVGDAIPMRWPHRETGKQGTLE